MSDLPRFIFNIDPFKDYSTYNQFANDYHQFCEKVIDPTHTKLKEKNQSLCDRYNRTFGQLILAINILEKIADPRLRDHKEPDAYTQLGCVMHMASEGLEAIQKFEIFKGENRGEDTRAEECLK